MSVKVTRSGITHCLSFCDSCDFQVDFDGNDMPEDVRRKVRAHVQKTGHRVVIETGKSTAYERI